MLQSTPHHVITSAEPICLLDDDPSILQALGRLFASAGLRTQRFTEPAYFLEYVQRHSVNLVLIDIQMPGMTGLEVLERLRKMAPNTKVLLMSGDSRPTHRTAAMEGGASALLLKPIDEEVLLRAVRAAIASSGGDWPAEE